MTLTKKQQELLILMLNEKGFRLNPNGQKIYKSRALYDLIAKLKEFDLVRSFKKEGDGSSFQLTDKGIFISSILAGGSKNKKIKYWLQIIYSEI